MQIDVREEEGANGGRQMGVDVSGGVGKRVN